MRNALTIVSVVFLCCTRFYGQQQDREPILLNHADSLVGKIVEGETVREVIGNVEFVQGDVIVRCQRAVHYPGRNHAELYGNVTVIRDTVTLTAPRGSYDGNKRQAFGSGGVRMWNKRLLLTAREGNYLAKDKVAFFVGNVKVMDSTTTITARQLTYFENEHKSIAEGDVKVVNTRDNGTIYGSYLEYFDDSKFSRMRVSPKYVQVDTSADGKIDTLIITAREMESYERPERRFTATDSVQLVRGALAGKSGEGLYYPEKDLVLLKKDPIIWYEDNQITGDSMRIQLQERKLREVFVEGNAFAISRSDTLPDQKSPSPTRFNQLTSQRMTLSFVDEELEHISADGTAISVYFLYEDGVPNGVNRASGDKIIVVSREGRAERINVIGGTEGKYYPENLVAGSESSYNLPGFRWRTDRPRSGKEFTIVSSPIEGNAGARLDK